MKNAWGDEVEQPAGKTNAWGDPVEAPAQDRPVQRQDRTMLQAAFPSSTRTKELGSYQVPLPGYGGLPNSPEMTVSPQQQQMSGAPFEALSLGTRALGASAGSMGYTGATGGKKPFKDALADPETGLMRPARKALEGVISNRIAGGADGKRGAGDILTAGVAGVGLLASGVLEDPFAIMGGIAKAAPKAVGKLSQKIFSPIGSAASTSKAGLSSAAKAGANKIQNTIIRPRQTDEAAGFNIENISKYGVDGSLEEVIGKSQSQIEAAANSLKALIKEGKDGGARIDLNKAVAEVEQEIFKGRAKEFANLKESPGALKDLRERIAILADESGGKVDLVDGQYVKQALGDMGAFEHIAGKQGVTISKEDRSLSQIASRVYLKLKDQIESAAPAGVKEQNRIMSDLIPVNRAALYRKLVSDRNNVVSMSDMLGAIATIGGGPKGLALWAASKATKSGGTAKSLYAAAKALKSAKSPAEAQFYSNALQKLGSTAAEIEAIQGVSGAVQAAQAPNIIPFRRAGGQ